jgi:hypothetical protein
MKTIKLFSLLVATGFITMSMGFPTDLTEKGKDKDVNGCQEARVVTVADKKPAKVVLVDTVEEDPAQISNMPMLASKTDKITVKVFDVKGALVLNQEVSMNEFLAKDKKASLPNGSTFVMFHANTAYYFLEAGLAK